MEFDEFRNRKRKCGTRTPFVRNWRNFEEAKSIVVSNVSLIYICICICIYILFYKRGFLIITGNEKERCWTRKGYWIRFDEDEREWKVEVERWCRALLCSVVTPDNGDATTVTASRLHCGSTHFLSTDLSPPWDKRVALSKSASTHVHFPELAT